MKHLHSRPNKLPEQEVFLPPVYFMILVQKPFRLNSIDAFPLLSLFQQIIPTYTFPHSEDNVGFLLAFLALALCTCWVLQRVINCTSAG